MSRGLAVVIPVLDEAPILPELVARARASALAARADAEVVVVDDGSTDDTPRVASRLSDGVVRFVRLGSNRGQLAATLAGLATCEASIVAVLDGDLQDPPELVPELVASLDRAPWADAAFAVKASRDDGPVLRVAARAHRAVLARIARRPPPAGAGSYCAIRAEVVARLCAARDPRGNLAPLVAAAAARWTTVAYRKAARWDGRSRVGLAGLAREALDSWWSAWRDRGAAGSGEAG